MLKSESEDFHKFKNMFGEEHKLQSLNYIQQQFLRELISTHQQEHFNVKELEDEATIHLLQILLNNYEHQFWHVTTNPALRDVIFSLYSVTVRIQPHTLL